MNDYVATAEEEVTEADWPGLDSAKSCIRCGSENIAIMYHPSHDLDIYWGCGGSLFAPRRAPHHVRTCERCGYRWVEKVLDPES
jgi:hypothetical protein